MEKVAVISMMLSRFMLNFAQTMFDNVLLLAALLQNSLLMEVCKRKKGTVGKQ